MANQDEIATILERHRAEIEQLGGVVGVAAGRTATGDDAIVVYLMHADATQALPSEVEGVPVEAVVTGAIDAQ